MNSSILLSEADVLRLEMIAHCQAPLPLPDARQQQQLNSLLARRAGPDRGSGAGFYDRVTLVSPTDDSDSFVFTIVMPDEADVDKDRISILMPICMAVIGRECGQIVAWETPAGHREMRVHSIEKASLESHAADTRPLPMKQAM